MMDNREGEIFSCISLLVKRETRSIIRVRSRTFDNTRRFKVDVTVAIYYGLSDSSKGPHCFAILSTIYQRRYTSRQQRKCSSLPCARPNERELFYPRALVRVHAFGTLESASQTSPSSSITNSEIHDTLCNF